MKKIFSKKTLSAFLAMVMIVAVIPMGMVTATAQTRTPAAAPAGATEINSAAKWNELAGTITSGDVVLTADIDFSTITDAPKTLFTTFSGTFYGNGKIIKNATIEAQALIATVLAKGTIQDVTVENCTVTSTDAKSGIIAGDAIDPGASTIQYCTIKDCTGNFTTDGGGILGSANKSVNILNCTVTGNTNIKGTGANAAILGRVYGGCYTLKIENCTVNESVTVSTNGNLADSIYALGLVVGCIGSDATGVQTAINIIGCSVNGYIQVSHTNQNACVGALIGLANGSDVANAKYTISGNIVGGEIVVGTKTNAGNAYAGGIVGYLKTRSSGNLITENVVSTNIYAHYRVGGIIGECANTKGDVSVSKCKFAGSLSAPNATQGNTNMGGILGYFAQTDSTVSININHCEISANISNNLKLYTEGRGVGGVIGRLGNKNNSMPCKVTVSDCLISGTMSNKVDSANNAHTAGVIGSIYSKDITVDIDDIVVTATINGNTDPELIYFKETNGDITVTVDNCATTIKKGSMLFIPNDTTVMNYIVSKEGNYISDVDIRDLLPKTYIQTSSVDSKTDTYIIRFVIESLVKNYDKVTTKIVVKNGEGGEVVKTFTFEECTYFESLTGHRSDITETYVAGEGAYKDCECFIAVAIMDVPNDGNDYFFEVTPTFTLGGITVEGTTFGGNYSDGRPTTN